MRLRVVVVFLLFVSGLPILYSLSFSLYRVQKALELIAEDHYIVARVSGRVERQRSESVNWMPLRVGETVTKGDAVCAGPDAEADIIFADGLALRIKSDTMIVLGSDKYGGGAVRLVVANGNVLARVVVGENPVTGQAANTGLNEAGLILRTPLVSTHVQGTSLLLGYDQGSGARLLVNDGTVGLRLNADPDVNTDLVLGMQVEAITDLTFRFEDQPLGDDEWFDLGEEINEIPVTASVGQLLRDLLTGDAGLADFARLSQVDGIGHGDDERLRRLRDLAGRHAGLDDMTEAELEELLEQIRALGYDELDLFLDAETFEQMMIDITSLEMKNIARGIEILGRIPGEAPSELSALELRGGDLIDAWGVDYDYSREPGRAVLRSAGPDREFNSDDDLVHAIYVR